MLKLIEIDNGQFDLVFDATAMANSQIAFTTLVYAILFTDAAANENQEPDRYQRRGWWFDNTAGSQIWWYRKQALSKDVRLAVINNITYALSSHPALSNVDVTDKSSVGNVSCLTVSITAVYNNLNNLITVVL